MGWCKGSFRILTYGNLVHLPCNMQKLSSTASGLSMGQCERVMSLGPGSRYLGFKV